MSAIVIPTRSLRYPTGAFEMNERSYQARGLVAWYPMTRVGSQLTDFSPRNNHGAIQANVSIEWSGQLGQPVLRGIANSGQSSSGVLLPDIYGASTPEGSLMVYCSNFGNVSGAPVDYSTDFNVHHYPFGGTDNGNNCYCNALYNTRVNVNDWLPNKDAWHWYCVRTKNGTNNWQWWQDGRKIAQGNGNSALPQPGSTRRCLVSNSASNQGYGGYVAEARFYDRYLSDEEMIRLAKAPLDRFELYKARPSRVWFIPDQAQTIIIASPLSIAPTIPTTAELKQTLIVGSALSVPPSLPSPTMASIVGVNSSLSVPPTINTPALGLTATVGSPVSIAPTINAPVVEYTPPIVPTTLALTVTIPTPTIAVPITVNSVLNVPPTIGTPVVVYTPPIVPSVLALTILMPSPTINQSFRTPLLFVPVSIFVPLVFDDLDPITPLAEDERTLKVTGSDSRTLKTQR